MYSRKQYSYFFFLVLILNTCLFVSGCTRDISKVLNLSENAEELDDLEFYTKRNTGVAFSEQRLRDFFSSDFEIISIEKCGHEITEEYIDIPLLYGCVMKLK